MSEGTVLKSLPKLVDPRKLAQIGGEFHGILKLDHLPRLSEATESVEHIEAKLAFYFNDEGKRVLDGNIKASLTLQCQRCMGNLETQFDIPVYLMLVWDEEQAASLPKDRDPWIVGEGEHDLHSVLEEELLLAIPPVVYHDYECVAPEAFSVGDEASSKAESKPNPFSILEGLKTKH